MEDKTKGKVDSVLESLFNKYGKYLIYFLPFFLLTGPFLPDLSISLLGIIFIYLSLTRDLNKYYKNYFTILFFLFYLYLLVASFFSLDPSLSFKSIIFYFRFIFLVLIVWYFIDVDRSFIKNFGYFLIAAFLFALFDGYYQYLYDESIFGYTSKLTRLTLPFNDDLLLGSYISRLFPLLFGLIIFSHFNSKYFLLISFLFLVLCDVLVFLSGERTALGILIIATVFVVIFIEKYRKIRIFSFLFSLTIISIIAIYSPEIKTRNIDYTITQLGLENNNTQFQEEGKLFNKVYLFSEQHHSIINTAFNIFQDNLLLGSGPNSFRVLCDKDEYSFDEQSCSTHPHNNFVQILSELGLVGLIFYLMLCIILFFYFFRFKIDVKKSNLDGPGRNFKICLFACFLITIFPFLPSQNLFHNWINIIYYLPIGFYLGIMQTR